MLNHLKDRWQFICDKRLLRLGVIGFIHLRIVSQIISSVLKWSWCSRSWRVHRPQTQVDLSKKPIKEKLVIYWAFSLEKCEVFWRLWKIKKCVGQTEMNYLGPSHVSLPSSSSFPIIVNLVGSYDRFHLFLVCPIYDPR